MIIYTLVTYRRPNERKPAATEVERIRWGVDEVAQEYGRYIFQLFAVISRLLPPELQDFIVYPRTIPHTQLQIELGTRAPYTEFFDDLSMFRDPEKEILPGNNLLDQYQEYTQDVRKAMKKIEPFLEDTFLEENAPLLVMINTEKYTKSPKTNVNGPMVFMDKRNKTFQKLYNIIYKLPSLIRTVFPDAPEDEYAQLFQNLEKAASFCQRVLHPLGRQGEFLHEKEATFQPRMQTETDIRQQLQEISEYTQNQVSYHLHRQPAKIVAPMQERVQRIRHNKRLHQKQRKNPYASTHTGAKRVGSGWTIHSFNTEVMEKGLTDPPKNNHEVSFAGRIK